ncbi:MAG: preprotein translocase subunit SecA [Candidatus Komeilibacteria bacterium]|nr:preprotein translocase subunit SecA [Candidatus Komeilibacteria bacterium]
MSILSKILGDGNARYLKTLEPIIAKINSLEQEFESFSNSQFPEKTEEFKARLQKGESLDDLLPEAFALAREAGRRTLKQRHYDVQLIGGIVLHKGQIAEMKTGEGKTLVATLPVYLNALSAKGVHLITVNDYLARRDSVWMGQIYSFLGLSVACIQHESAFMYDAAYVAPPEVEQERDLGVVVNENFLRPVSRHEAYLADITYGTNNEFGFDYLRDNMVPDLSQMVQRELNFAIVDEVDSILIDEARTPLIISGAAEESTEKYRLFAKLVKTLTAVEDYNIDEKMRAVALTENGIEKIEHALGVKNIYEAGGVATVHHLESALKAETLFKRDKDYVVKDDEVLIVDEFTGRLMHGRRYSEGLHQAIEAKEGVKVQRESVTMATVTFQNFFRLYKKLAGMTGTAATESEEFSKIYKLDVTVIPTNKPLLRKDGNDLIYKTEQGKFKAVIEEIKTRQKAGQPTLVGSISIEKNELLSELLSREGVKHEILNAKNHEREAQIIAQAGKKGSVTLATNMAGRGVDIILGGHPYNQELAEEVRSLGGLHVIGTERHESRRIDNQLRGRSGRQGDPGSSRFFVSLDDDLMRIFGSERIKSVMTTLKVPDDMPIENGLISKSLESAQKKVEGHNFDTRKHLVEYDDVINKHREVIYKKRREILELAQNQNGEGKSSKTIIQTYLSNELSEVLNVHALGDNPEAWNIEEVVETVNAISPLTDDEKQIIKDQTSAEALRQFLLEWFDKKYDSMATAIASQDQFTGQVDPMRRLEKSLLLQTIDTLWIEHLEAIDHLRTGIGLRGYGQRDPLVEYKAESYKLFKTLLSLIQNQVVYTIFKIGQAAALAQSPMAKAQLKFQGAQKTLGNSGSNPVANAPKVGRNDPCPCGAKKSDNEPIKFKHCHGR